MQPAATLRHNVAVVGRRPQLKLIAPSASPQEAAAIVAALERFMRETAARRRHRPAAVDPWLRAALLEAVEARRRAGPVGDPPPWPAAGGRRRTEIPRNPPAFQ